MSTGATIRPSSRHASGMPSLSWMWTYLPAPHGCALWRSTTSALALLLTMMTPLRCIVLPALGRRKPASPWSSSSLLQLAGHACLYQPFTHNASHCVYDGTSEPNWLFSDASGSIAMPMSPGFMPLQPDACQIAGAVMLSSLSALWPMQRQC